MPLWVVNVPLQPTRVPHSLPPKRALRLPLACSRMRDNRQPRVASTAPALRGKVVLARHFSLVTQHSLPLFSISFVLTSFRTFVLATPFFSHTSLKHPGWHTHLLTLARSMVYAALISRHLHPPLPLAHCTLLPPVPQSTWASFLPKMVCVSADVRRTALQAKKHSAALWCLIY